ncbi:M23 family metallopeptidase [Arvimicrobium flavum]|uniref:M23 family metallopeptidase n=1 Tax=Arvimicrobium flavum TaxID=3393320 RepID=UPI00237ACB05|nr:M23 family metallopeptidase [Mesorhizobium shangrilense]
MTGIWENMTPEMQESLGDEDALARLRNDLRRSAGSETEILEETTESRGGQTLYLRTSRWTGIDAPILMRWAFNEDGQISGFFVQPKPALAESRFLDYQTKATLRLPFDGEWLVFWGGRTLEQNYHAADRAQRFATDFVVRENGVTFRGDGTILGNYYCWDRPILAPAAGKVVSAVRDLPDQPIGQADRDNPAGNHVVLDLGNNEFAFLAHFRQGSVPVSAGDTVTAGQMLGRCGNSGNSSEPHLHFHLQNTPDLKDGEGLPAFFEDFLADGVAIGRGEPVKGQVVAPDGAG